MLYWLTVYNRVIQYVIFNKIIFPCAEHYILVGYDFIHSSLCLLTPYLYFEFPQCSDNFHCEVLESLIS